MNKMIAKVFGSLVVLLFFACGNNDNSASSANEEESGQKESSSLDTLVRCEVEGSFAWNESGKSYFLCEDGIMQLHEVEPHKAGFDACQFNFGAEWQAAHEDSAFYAGLDYVAVWLGDNAYYNDFENRMVDLCVRIGATPMIYGYVIAEFGKDRGLVDCDAADVTHTKTLCTDGANLIREFFADSILHRYSEYAFGIKRRLNGLDIDLKKYKTIWLIEPDFYQYSATGSAQKEERFGIAQNGGGIPDEEMGKYFKQIVDTIRYYLPAAEIAIDISPWISDWKQTSQSAWYSNFDMSIVDYASTSGGRTSAGTEKIRTSNLAKWKDIYDVVKKPILADAGYGHTGSSTGHDAKWDDVMNIQARMADGVVGVMQMNAKRGYPAIADTIRPQLKYDFPWCKK